MEVFHPSLIRINLHVPHIVSINRAAVVVQLVKCRNLCVILDSELVRYDIPQSKINRAGAGKESPHVDSQSVIDAPGETCTVLDVLFRPHADNGSVVGIISRGFNICARGILSMEHPNAILIRNRAIFKVPVNISEYSCRPCPFRIFHAENVVSVLIAYIQREFSIKRLNLPAKHFSLLLVRIANNFCSICLKPNIALVHEFDHAVRITSIFRKFKHLANGSVIHRSVTLSFGKIEHRPVNGKICRLVETVCDAKMSRGFLCNFFCPVDVLCLFVCGRNTKHFLNRFRLIRIKIVSAKHILLCVFNRRHLISKAVDSIMDLFPCSIIHIAFRRNGNSFPIFANLITDAHACPFNVLIVLIFTGGILAIACLFCINGSLFLKKPYEFKILTCSKTIIIPIRFSIEIISCCRVGPLHKLCDKSGECLILRHCV